jgi:hypothetical protein
VGTVPGKEGATSAGKADSTDAKDPANKVAHGTGATGATGATDAAGETIERVQIRSMTTNVQPPSWSGTPSAGNKPYYRTLSWWTVTPADVPLSGSAAGPGPKTTTTEAKAR